MDRLPLRPETLGPLLAAMVTLATAEVVRSGIYGGYLTQAVDTHFGLPLALGGVAYTVHFATDTVMRGPAGVMINRFGLRAAMLGGALLSVLAIALFMVAHTSWLFLLAAALHGLGFAVMWPGTMNFAADAARDGYHGRALTLVGTAITPFSGLGFLLFGALAKRDDNVPLLVALALLTLGALLALLVPARRVLQPREEDAGGPQPVRSVTRALVPLLPAAFMQTMTMSLLGPLLFRMAPDLGLNYWGLVGLLVVGGGVAFGSMPLTGRFADRGRARLGVMVGYGLLSLGFLGFAMTPQQWVLYLLAVVAGLGYAFLTPAWAALVTHVLPAEQRPAAWGVLMTVENGGMALGPLIGTFALGQAGVPGPFIVGAVLAAVTAGGYAAFGRAFRGAAA
ncbi:MFS transporter [Deinococcus sedimenti]|uniref:MFS transporter n=1 Tax=Deinococcus sedimenti TaxID=1867090 RepID=A0ABQ2S5C4_9DEIO|nr:MFS transporter [Deinococcus sedimenti]